MVVIKGEQGCGEGEEGKRGNRRRLDFVWRGHDGEYRCCITKLYT